MSLCTTKAGFSCIMGHHSIPGPNMSPQKWDTVCCFLVSRFLSSAINLTGSFSEEKGSPPSMPSKKSGLLIRSCFNGYCIKGKIVQPGVTRLFAL